jgi:hypothetical protein
MAIGSFSDAAETDILSKEFGATNYTAPATHYVGLSSTSPGDTGSGITEPSTGSYAGQTLTNNTTNWGVTGDTAQNNTAISFPQATAPGWGARLRYWFIKVTNGAGALRAWGQLVGSYLDFTADSSTDTITSTSHGYVNGTPVLVESQGGSLPGGLSADTTYYVINATTNTFKLSATLGGSAIDLTSNGTGRLRVAEDKSQDVTSGTTFTIPVGGLQVKLD